MSYQCKILQLNACYDWRSILFYDRDYRIFQSQYGFGWITEIPHLFTTTLVEKDKNFSKPLAPKQNPRQHTSQNNFNSNKNYKKSDQKTCRDFNRGLCTHNPCIYVHTCSIPGCDKAHPASQHSHAESKNL